jgi:hypothetical protein
MTELAPMGSRSIIKMRYKNWLRIGRVSMWKNAKLEEIKL